MGFDILANTHGGEASPYRFSAHHSITSAEALSTAFVLMAFAQVFFRVAISTPSSRETRWRSCADQNFFLRPTRCAELCRQTHPFSRRRPGVCTARAPGRLRGRLEARARAPTPLGPIQAWYGVSQAQK